MMYMKPDTNAHGIPFISKDYIDDFCSNLISRFEPSVLSRLHPVNIEQFVQRCLGCRLRYEYLSCDGSILGASMFKDTDAFPIYDPQRRQTVYTRARQGTVFIDKGLTAADKNNLCRFTLAHEAGHMLWHGMYIGEKAKVSKEEPYLMCTSSDVASAARLHKHEKLSSTALVERQANRSASALLMPKEAVLKLIASIGECRNRNDATNRILCTASLFRVSCTAARMRLTELGLINPILLSTQSRSRHSA